MNEKEAHHMIKTMIAKSNNYYHYSDSDESWKDGMTEKEQMHVLASKR